jgi:hypothetical protein
VLLILGDELPSFLQFISPVAVADKWVRVRREEPNDDE